jgi:hypothetical protein
MSTASKASSALHLVPKVASEVAESEFERMCDAHRIKHDVERDEAELAEWQGIRAPIVRALMEGTLIVDEGGLPTYTPAGGGKSITFHKATGATYMALETYAASKNIQNMAAAMAEMTHVPVGTFSALEALDFQVCMRLGKLFLLDR